MRTRLLVATLAVAAAAGAGKLAGCSGAESSTPATSGGGTGGGVAGRAGSGGGGSSGVGNSGGGGAAGTGGAPVAGAAGASAGGVGQSGAAGAAGGKPADDIPGWESFLRVRGDCVLRRPKGALEELVPPLSWKPCVGGAPCQELDTGWAGGLDDSFGERSVAIQRPAGHPGWMSMVQVYPKYPGVRITSAFDLPTGKPLFAWASECLEKYTTTTDELFLGYGSLAEGLWLLWAKPASFDETPRAQLPFSILNNLTLGTKYVAWNTSLLSLMAREGGAPFSVKYDVPGTSSFLEFVGSDAYFITADPNFTRIWVRRDDGGTEELVAVPGSHVEALSSDGTTMSWFVTTGQFVNADGATVSKKVELFASPHANSKAGVVPTRLGRLTYLENKALGFGWKARGGVVSYAGARPLSLFRMSDGAFKTLPDAPPIAGTKWGSLAWADDQDVFVVVLKGIIGKTILRYRVDDLGPWQPLPQ